MATGYATGVAVGGFLSVANADIVLMEAESRAGWGSEFRFRDNALGFCPESKVHYGGALVDSKNQISIDRISN